MSYTQRLIAMRAKILEEGVEGWRLQDTSTSKEWVFQTPLETVSVHRQTRATVDLPAPRWIYRLHNTPLNKAPLGFLKSFDNPLVDLQIATSSQQRLQWTRLLHTVALQAWELGVRSSLKSQHMSYFSSAQGEVVFPWNDAQFSLAQSIAARAMISLKGADLPFHPVVWHTLKVPSTHHDMMKLHALDIEPLWPIL